MANNYELADEKLAEICRFIMCQLPAKNEVVGRKIIIEIAEKRKTSYDHGQVIAAIAALINAGKVKETVIGGNVYLERTGL